MIKTKPITITVSPLVHAEALAAVESGRARSVSAFFNDAAEEAIATRLKGKAALAAIVAQATPEVRAQAARRAERLLQLMSTQTAEATS